MAIISMSRRGLLRRLGLGVGGVTLVGVGAACGSESENDRREAAKQRREEDRALAAAAPVAATVTNNGSHGATVVQASPAQRGHSAEEMDRHHHEEGVKAFPAKTRGLGGQPLAFEMDGDTKVFRLTCETARCRARRSA